MLVAAAMSAESASAEVFDVDPGKFAFFRQVETAESSGGRLKLKFGRVPSGKLLVVSGAFCHAVSAPDAAPPKAPDVDKALKIVVVLGTVAGLIAEDVAEFRFGSRRPTIFTLLQAKDYLVGASEGISAEVGFRPDGSEQQSVAAKPAFTASCTITGRLYPVE